MDNAMLHNDDELSIADDGSVSRLPRREGEPRTEGQQLLTALGLQEIEHPAPAIDPNPLQTLRDLLTEAKAIPVINGVRWTPPQPLPTPAQGSDEWRPYDKIQHYEAKRVVDPSTDPDCRPAFRNGHDGIDLEPREAVGQVPIFITKIGRSEVEPGDWLVCWEGQRDSHVWVDKNFGTNAALRSKGGK